MPTGTRSKGGAGPTVVLTTLPRPGTVLLRSPAPPAVAVDNCVDVRPGPAAWFDGDRLRVPIWVCHGEERRRFGRDELPAVETEVAALLRGDGAAAVRFGDRSACRRLLPAAAVAAIERRLATAARHEDQTLVTWSARPVGDTEPGHYDVVFG